VIEPLALLGREQQFVGVARRPERSCHLLGKRHAPLLPALRQPDAGPVVPALNVEPLLAEIEIGVTGLDRLAESQAGLRKEDEERPNWKPGDAIPLGSDRTLRVIEVRPGPEPYGDPILVVEALRPGSRGTGGG
jgi:hypothetical protein